MSGSPTSTRFWAMACAVIGLGLGAVLVVLVEQDVVTCRRELRSVAEPAGWQTWPALPDLGGYRIDGERANCVGHGLQCGLRDTELGSDSLCPRGGLSLDVWFNGSIYQSTSDITLRESNGTFVASGHDRMKSSAGATDDEKFVVAFRPHTGWPRPAFTHRSAALVSLVVSGLILNLLWAAVRARKLMNRRARCRDDTQYRSGRRDESGVIGFDDGSPWLPAAGAPGPVLVRIVATAQGTYRTAPQTTADEIFDGELDAITEQLRAEAAKQLRRAGVASVAIGVAVVLCAVVATILEGLSQMN